MKPVAKGAAVVAGWTAGNAVLTVVLVFFHEQSFAILLYACSTALPILFAGAVLGFAGWNPSAEDEFDLGANAVWTVPGALGLVLIGAGTFAGVVAAWLGGLLVLASLIQLLRGSVRPGEELPDAAA